MSAANSPEVRPLAYSMRDAAAASSLSPRKLEQFVARGVLTVQWADGKRLIDADELKAFIKSLPYSKPEGGAS